MNPTTSPRALVAAVATLITGLACGGAADVAAPPPPTTAPATPGDPPPAEVIAKPPVEKHAVVSTRPPEVGPPESAEPPPLPDIVLAPKEPPDPLAPPPPVAAPKCEVSVTKAPLDARVASVVSRFAGQLRGCCGEAALTAPVDVKLSWTLDGGRANDAKADGPGVLGACLTGRVARWSFPPDAASGLTEVTVHLEPVKTP